MLCRELPGFYTNRREPPPERAPVPGEDGASRPPSANSTSASVFGGKKEQSDLQAIEATGKSACINQLGAGNVHVCLVEIISPTAV